VRTRDDRDWERSELAVGGRLPVGRPGPVLPQLRDRPGRAADRAGQDDLRGLRGAAGVPGVRA